MAYMRGEQYLWRDANGYLHIWVADGYDAWDQAAWATDEDGARRRDRVNASGVQIPQTIIDQYVMLRLTELIDQGLIAEAIDRAVESGRNAATDRLRQQSNHLKSVLSALQNPQREG